MSFFFFSPARLGLSKVQIIIIRWRQATQSLILGEIWAHLKPLQAQSLPMTRVYLYILDDL